MRCSGASGGNMGLSMYTYLKADPTVSLDEIEERIEALGSGTICARQSQQACKQ